MVTESRYPEEIREDDGDDLGAVMGYHLDGHVDLATVEWFMGEPEIDEVFDGAYAPRRGFDVEHLWVRKVPAEFGWRYQYSRSPGRGLHPVTRIERDVHWEHWCLNHPDELAVAGLHPARVADAEPLPGDGRVYVCRDCYLRFQERESKAIAEALSAT